MRFNERIKVVTVEGSTKKTTNESDVYEQHMCSKLVGIAAFISFWFVFYCCNRTYKIRRVCVFVFVCLCVRTSIRTKMQQEVVY